MSASRNKEFLSAIDSDAKDAIIEAIAAHNGITAVEAYSEVTTGEAEHLLEYLVGAPRAAASALMQRYELRH